MRVYSITGSFKSDTIYHLRCEYCGHEQSIYRTQKRDVKVEIWNTPPTTQDLLTSAQQEFKRQQDTILSNAGKGVFEIDRKSALCENCGFFPTYMINRKQNIGMIILLLIISAGPGVLFFIPGGLADAAMAITISLGCFVPILVLLGIFFLRLNPNRKMMRTLRSEGRSLLHSEKPRIDFGAIQLIKS